MGEKRGVRRDGLVGWVWDDGAMYLCNVRGWNTQSEVWIWRDGGCEICL